MKIRQVSYFLALCKEKSFTQAAKRCGVKQPSITVAIRQLEAELGGPLFERNNSSIQLTNLGNIVRPDLVRIERAAANAKHKAARFVTGDLAGSKPNAQEPNMRAIAVTVAALALFLMGLAVRPAPSETAAPVGQATAQVSPYGLQLTTERASF